MQFRVTADDFLRFCAVERRLSPHTIQAYGGDLADFEKWRVRSPEMDAVSTGTLKAYLNHMVDERKLSVATVRRRLACLRAFYRRLSDLGQRTDPFGNWRLQLPRRKRLPRALSRPEVSHLLAAPADLQSRESMVDPILRIVLRLMVSTGVRVGELCKVQVDDVSPDGSTVRIHGKGSRERIAYVGDTELRNDLTRLLAARRRAGAEIEALFVNRYGLPMQPQSIRSKLRRYASDRGIARRITPHMLRHTAATLLIETGVDIRFVQRLLGHSSIATTEIYTHVSDEALKATLERADVLGILARH